MLKTILILFAIFSALILKAQTYPEVILPYSSKTIESGTDTLWIMKDSQLKKAILSAKKLAIEEEISMELRKKISLMEEKDKVKDSLIVDLKKDRDFYIDYWKTCSGDVQLLLKKQKRQKLFTRLSLAGIVVAFIGGIFIGK